MIANIITKAPLYVWPLLVYLVIIGLKARKSHTLSTKRLFIFPLIFSAWALYTICTRSNIYHLLILLGGLIIGIAAGFRIVRPLPIRFDKAHGLVELPGSWLTLILVVSIFSLKFFLGATQASYPDLKGTWLLLIPELAATIIAGIFTGRGIGYWQKYKAASSTLIE